MPLIIVRNDITNMVCDAVVNPTDRYFSGSGGTDLAVHTAAGPEMDAACAALGEYKSGGAAMTPGFGLPCRFVIHTVGPVWEGGCFGEEETLKRCYKSCLELAKSCKCESIAFPLIAAGTFGYPAERAMKLARSVITEFLENDDMTVYLVLFGERDYLIGRKLFARIKDYIEENRDYGERFSAAGYQSRMPMAPCAVPKPEGPRRRSAEQPRRQEIADARAEIRFEPDESFSEMLLRKIDESGMTDSQCYNKANIDRKLFSKIRSNPDYRPSKPTVMAFGIALELPLDEFRSLLEKAGFALSHSIKGDLIVEYFIKHGNYNIFDINEALFEFDQMPIGGK